MIQNTSLPLRLPHRARTVLLGALVLAVPLASPARNTIRGTFFSLYPNAVGSKLDNLPNKAGHCGVCHMDFNGSGTRNPYGNAIASSGFALNSEAGRSNAIYSIHLRDSDGDGFTNSTEIVSASYTNTPTFPGLTPGNVGSVVNVPAADLPVLQAHLVPSTGVDTTPPLVTVTYPSGGQSLVANRATNITWTATDASGISAIDLYLSLDSGATYQPVALGLGNTGSYAWFPANRPAASTARLRIVAVDNANRSGTNQSGLFSIVPPPGGRVPSTLRDFDLPGTQPFEAKSEIDPTSGCATCHGGYNPAVEPHRNWQGSMMAHASRDPLFLANMAIANQDAPDSGDLCLRCHFPRGWLGGRSVPTDGSRMQRLDREGVSCDVCHRMVNPVYAPGTSPTNDISILAALSFRGTNYGNGMFVIDPFSAQRGPFTNPAAPHTFAASPFHRSAAFCGTCHDVSNPAFQNDGTGHYVANGMDTTATNFSPHFMAPVERTYSEWLASAYNTPGGVHAPQFAGNKAGGFVSTCQDCHMRDVAGYGCDTNQFPATPLRQDIPLHDMTGGSIWLAGMLTNLHPTEVNAAAIQAGIERSIALLTNSATLGVADASGQIKVTVTNECGHKLPTGYPEGRRVWLNMKFYNEAGALLGESGAYNTNTGVITRDAQAKIYEIHPGLETNLANALGLPPGPSYHFVLNNRTYEDNRIPPRGFTNAAFAAFGGAPVGHHYDDGQYWDDTLYTLPAGAVRAEVKLYYQSTSKEFVEFLRDENTTTSHGQVMYDLWNNNGKCPPTLMTSATWLIPFQMKGATFTANGWMQIRIGTRPGTSYTIEYADLLSGGVTGWQTFQNNGTKVAATTELLFEDDFTPATSGGAPATGQRYYRFRYLP